MHPKIAAKVICADRPVGDVTQVVVNPISKAISHLVVKAGGQELLVPVEGNVTSITEQEVRLGCPVDALARFERFRRSDFVSIKEVEIPHLERHLDVIPGDVLVPLPVLEKDLSRRSFFTRFTNVIGALIGLPLVYPVLRYLGDPMFQPFDNSWLSFGRTSALREPGVPQVMKFKKSIREGFLTRNFEKTHWVMRSSPELNEKIYPEGDREFRDRNGELIWTNSKDNDVVVFSGKCPHLGCAYRLRKHRTFGQAFVCPCHLSVFAMSGEVLDGPSPRPLDRLDVEVKDGLLAVRYQRFKQGVAAKEAV